MRASYALNIGKIIYVASYALNLPRVIMLTSQCRTGACLHPSPF